MNIRQILLTGITVIVLATGNALADSDKIDHSSRAVAPEIDVTSGTSAIGLLTGVLLLMGERSRSRRS